MAINLNCNLNGGDSVTPNNELFYRIYGDVDAYSSPIHTTGTAIADADVTVTGDVVDILNVDVTTNTEFKIAAVDGAGNEGILSDAKSRVILFSETFPPSTLDTDNWVQTGSTDIDDTFNNGLTLTDNKTLETGTDIFRLESNTKWNYNNTGKDLFIIINVDSSGIIGNPTPRAIYLIDVADDNRIGFSSQADTPWTGTDIISKENGGAVEFTEVANAFTGSFKMSLVGGTASLYLWNGSSWGTALTSHSYTDSTDYYLRVQRDTRCTDTQSFVVNHVYALDTDITTETP